ncbi:MAG: SH3 domain-containing protein [Candidatus Omnitrophota bacterium]
MPSKMHLRWLGCFLIVNCIFSASANLCYALDEAIVTKDRINVRVDATAMAPSIGFLKRGEKVKIIDERFEWYKITLPKRFSAYAAAEFLKEIDNNKVEVIASNLNLRDTPSMSSYVIGQAEKGTVFFFRRKKNNWFEVRGYPHIYGWVNKNFLEKREKVINLEGTLFPVNDANCEANYILKTPEEKYLLNILTKGKTKYMNKKVKIEGVMAKGSCSYVVVYKLVFVR